LALAGVGYALVSAAQPRELAPRYLFAWVGDDDREDSDFLAVIDLGRHGDRYGTIVATTPVGEKGLWPQLSTHSRSEINVRRGAEELPDWRHSWPA
jgi:hypothetical protein